MVILVSPCDEYPQTTNNPFYSTPLGVHPNVISPIRCSHQYADSVSVASLYVQSGPHHVGYFCWKNRQFCQISCHHVEF